MLYQCTCNIIEYIHSSMILYIFQDFFQHINNIRKFENFFMNFVNDKRLPLTFHHDVEIGVYKETRVCTQLQQHQFHPDDDIYFLIVVNHQPKNDCIPKQNRNSKTEIYKNIVKN